MKITAQEIVDRFATTPTALRKLETWQRVKSKRVAPVVMGHTSSVVLGATLGEVRQVGRKTEHALGESKWSEVSQCLEIRDWNPDFAFTHVFHVATEAVGAIPTYQDLRRFCKEDALGQEMLWIPAMTAVDASSSSVAPAAMRWRIGNAYYSFLREMYVAAFLRERGLEVGLHPLADALFRVDAWVDDFVMSLFIGNRSFRSGNEGRKTKAEEILDNQRFKFLSVELPTKRTFGSVHFPDDVELDKLYLRLTGANVR